MVVLADEEGIVSADVPFRRTKSKYNVKQISVTINFYGDELQRVSFEWPSIICDYDIEIKRL